MRVKGGGVKKLTAHSTPASAVNKGGGPRTRSAKTAKTAADTSHSPEESEGGLEPEVELSEEHPEGTLI